MLVPETRSPDVLRPRLRPLVLTAMLLVLVQAAVGMVVNLYVTIPTHHPGAHPSNYFGGSSRGVVWSIAHGAPALAIHAALGLGVVLAAIVTAVRSLRDSKKAIAVWSSLAALLVIGAGFNGASFLDFNDDASSLIMALLALAAVACYSVVMFLIAAPAEG